MSHQLSLLDTPNRPETPESSIVVPVRAHTRRVRGVPVGSAPHSRKADPVSSHEAGEKAPRKGQAAELLEFMRGVSTARTASEWAMGVPQWGPMEQARIVVNRRLPDLEKAGHVTRGQLRHSSVTGRTEVEWRAVTRCPECERPEGDYHQADCSLYPAKVTT